MKTIFTIILFSIFVSTSSVAQQWASPGSEWNFTQKIVFGDRIPTTIKVVDQFLLNGLLVSELKVENEVQCGVIFGRILTYEEGGKVYFKEVQEANFKLLYDFEAEIGESWVISLNDGQLQETVTYTVEHISEVNVEGSLRKQLHCQVTYESGVLDSQEDAYIVEGIGDLHYLFPWMTRQCTEGYIEGLCEYSDNEIQSYSPNSGVDCVTSVSVNPETEMGYFILSPNPVRESLNISLPVNAPANLITSIFNAQGKIIHQAILNKESNTQISVSDWSTGLYFVKSNIGGKTQISKFIKH